MLFSPRAHSLYPSFSNSLPFGSIFLWRVLCWHCHIYLDFCCVLFLLLCASNEMTHNWMLLLLFVENTLHMITYLPMLKTTKHFKRSYIYFRAREKTQMQLDRVNVVARFDSNGWANRERKRVNSNRNILSSNDSTLFYLWINMQSICASCKCVLLTRRRRQFSNTSICICKNLIANEWRKTSSKKRNKYAVHASFRCE